MNLNEIDGGVEIKVMQRTDRTLYYEIEVRSVTKPQSLFQGILEVGKNTNEEKAVMILAGAMAEEIAARLGDNQIDPGKIASTAGICYRELHQENPHILAGNEMPRYADSRVGLN